MGKREREFADFSEPAGVRNRLAWETARVGARAAVRERVKESSVMASPRGFCLPGERAPRMVEIQAGRERREGRERAHGHGIDACREARAQRQRAYIERVAAVACESVSVRGGGSRLAACREARRR